MIISYVSDDIQQAREKASSKIKNLLDKHSNALYLNYDEENFVTANLEELAFSNALFKNNYIVLLHNIFAKKESKEKFLKNIELLAESQNLFFVTAQKLTQKDLELLKKHSHKLIQLQNLNLSKQNNETKSKEVFKLVDALAIFDLKNAWLVLQKLKKTHEAEQVYGVLWWFLKNAKNSNKRFQSFAQFIDLDTIILNFIDLPYRTYKYRSSLYQEIEKWILSLRKK